MKLVGVLVCYYPDYKAKAISKIKSILDMTCKQNLLIVVNNNPLLEKNSDGVGLEVVGSNTNWEFSGWDEGISYLEKIITSEDPIVVLANDTFCHHHHFGKLMTLKYCISVKMQISSKRRYMLGFTNELRIASRLANKELKKWVSSYLFSIRYSDLKTISPLTEVNELNFKKYFLFSDEKVVPLNSDKVFLEHINKWLFPSDNTHGWYKSKCRKVNRNLIFKKSIAIFNEKLMSLRCEQSGIEIKDVNETLPVKILNSITKYIE